MLSLTPDTWIYLFITGVSAFVAIFVWLLRLEGRVNVLQAIMIGETGVIGKIDKLEKKIDALITSLMEFRMAPNSPTRSGRR